MNSSVFEFGGSHCAREAPIFFLRLNQLKFAPDNIINKETQSKSVTRFLKISELEGNTFFIFQFSFNCSTWD